MYSTFCFVQKSWYIRIYLKIFPTYIPPLNSSSTTTPLFRLVWNVRNGTHSAFHARKRESAGGPRSRNPPVRWPAGWLLVLSVCSAALICVYVCICETVCVVTTQAPSSVTCLVFSLLLEARERNFSSYCPNGCLLLNCSLKKFTKTIYRIQLESEEIEYFK